MRPACRRVSACSFTGQPGAVGQALVSLGALAGLEIWGTARGEQADLVRSLGATPIDFTKQAPLDIVPNGFDVVFDGIGAHAFSGSWASVKRGGMLSAFGFSDSVLHGGSIVGLGFALLRLRLWDAFGHARAQFYSVGAMRKAHPTWFREDLGALFELLSTRTSCHASPIGSVSPMLRPPIDGWRQATWMAKSSFAHSPRRARSVDIERLRT